MLHLYFALNNLQFAFEPNTRLALCVVALNVCVEHCILQRCARRWVGMMSEQHRSKVNLVHYAVMQIALEQNAQGNGMLT